MGGALLIFWDTSAVVALIIEEKASEEIRRIYRDISAQTHLLWALTATEFYAAASRRLRERNLDQDGFIRCVAEFEELEKTMIVIADIDAVQERARRVLNIHPLKSADALQLAAALVATLPDPSQQTFLVLDSQLSEAAAKEGFRVLPR